MGSSRIDRRRRQGQQSYRINRRRPAAVNPAANPFLALRCPGQRTPPVKAELTAALPLPIPLPRAKNAADMLPLPCAALGNVTDWPAGRSILLPCPFPCLALGRVDRRRLFRHIGGRAALANPLPRAKNAADMLPLPCPGQRTAGGRNGQQD